MAELEQLEQNAVLAVYKYIVGSLQKQGFNRKRHHANYICMYAGDAVIEHAGMLRAQQEHGIKVDNIYCIDLYDGKNGIQSSTIRALMQPMCNHIFTGTFGDMTKLFMKMPAKKLKHYVCVAVHPGGGVFTDSPETNRAVLRAIGAPLHANARMTGQDAQTLMHIKRELGAKETGTFYKLLLNNFELEMALIWRDGNVCPVSAKDFAEEELFDTLTEEVRKKVHEKSRAKCVNVIDNNTPVTLDSPQSTPSPIRSSSKPKENALHKSKLNKKTRKALPSMKKTELYDIAKQVDLKNRSKMDKQGLLDALLNM